MCNLRVQLAVSRFLASYSFLIPTRLSDVCVCFQSYRLAEWKRIVLLFENYRVRNLDEELAFRFIVIFLCILVQILNKSLQSHRVISTIAYFSAAYGNKINYKLSATPAIGYKRTTKVFLITDKLNAQILVL